MPSDQINHTKSDSINLDIKRQIYPDNADQMFGAVFLALEDEVDVLPTENYLYFRIRGLNEKGGKEIWGNIRLSARDRDKGIIHFAYSDFVEPQSSRSVSQVRYRRLDATDGISVSKKTDFDYAVSYRGKQVIFHLNRIEQLTPKLFKLRQGEVFVQNIRDESGLNFHLLYDEKTSAFRWVLDETEEQDLELIEVDEDVLLEVRTRYVFYVDQAQQSRKILIGVEINNVRQNNYYDGPFDQLADNYITKESKLSKYMESAYPYARGLIDQYGYFIDREWSRIAITPYMTYESLGDVLKHVNRCKANHEGNDFYMHLAYDFKRDWWGTPSL